MSVDIGADLLLAITEAFQKAYDQDITIRVLEKRLNGGKAHLEDAARYSERVGELLANVYGELLSSEVLPNGRMYWNIAQKVIGEPLVNNYNLVAEASVNALSAQRRKRRRFESAEAGPEPGAYHRPDEQGLRRRAI